MKPLLTIFIIISAFFWAKLEIQIEGKGGWAQDLPGWRVDKHYLLNLLYGGRPLTGYHVWSLVFVLFAFHMPFFWTGIWSVRYELNVIGAYCLFWVTEDCLWFVLNPHYGWKKFRREHIWWHKKWLGRLPIEYWAFGTLGLLLLYFF
jgi:hypothetical protein